MSTENRRTSTTRRKDERPLNHVGKGLIIGSVATTTGLAIVCAAAAFTMNPLLIAACAACAGSLAGTPR